MTRFARSASGAPDKPPLSFAWRLLATPSRARVVLVATTPSTAWRVRVAAIDSICAGLEVGRDLDEHRHATPVLGSERVAARAQGVEERVERGVRLQLAQVLGVRARDVDGDVVGVRVHAIQAGEVVVGGARDRRRRVLADVETQDAAAPAKARAPDVADERAEPVVVEAHAVDQRAAPRGSGTCAASGCPVAPAASPSRPRCSRSPSRRTRRSPARSCRGRPRVRSGSETPGRRPSPDRGCAAARSGPGVACAGCARAPRASGRARVPDRARTGKGGPADREWTA